jgi:ATP-dependent Clp protease ATP-binding subunit ClpC
VFERFTEPARDTVRAAMDEARSMNHSYVGTEHLLLGLLRTDDDVVARVLSSFGLTENATRRRITQLVRSGDEKGNRPLPLTPTAKRALHESDRESASLDEPHIRPEHLLLGILDVSDGISSRVFVEFDVDREAIRTATLREIKDLGGSESG